MLEKIRHELRTAHPADLPVIRQYIGWLRFRRYMNNAFYLFPQAHWIKYPAHWV